LFEVGDKKHILNSREKLDEFLRREACRIVRDRGIAFSEAMMSVTRDNPALVILREALADSDCEGGNGPARRRR